jgi:predicted DsbA family dithiol-disulfide isomerase
MMQSRGDIGQGDQTTGQPSIGSPTAKTSWHWFDFTCPFCYVARSRNEILSRSGLVIVELPFQAHPEIPAGGATVGPRSGEMYDRLEREARDAGLPLRWPSRLPNSRYALSIAEWVRRHHPEGFTTLYYQLFLSHFSLGEDIGDTVLVDSYAEQAGADMDLIRRAISDGSADAAVVESELAARRIGLRGTPAWLIENHVVLGLQDRSLFEQVAREVADRRHDEKDALRLL